MEGLGFTSPSSKAKDIINQLKQDGYVKGRPIMGAQIGAQGYSGLSSVYVESVNVGSATEKAGVKSGDIILTAICESSGKLQVKISMTSGGYGILSK